MRLLLALAAVVLLALARQPNIVFILNDDLDLELGSPLYMPNVQALIAGQGKTFTNAFVSTPVCCPSRACLLTGQYQHNAGVLNNSEAGNCGQNFAPKESVTMATELHALGYRTSFFGKYLNGYYNYSHIPEGWDRWFALLGNSVFYNYNVSDQGEIRQYNATYPSDYLPLLVQNQALTFMQSTLEANVSQPFFMYIAPPTPHQPADYEPAYNDTFSDSVAPRTPAYNASSPDKHWMMRIQYPMNSTIELIADNLWRARLRSLQTTDTFVEDIYNMLNQYGVLDDTIIVFTSDNGFLIGTYRIISEKRQIYEPSIRIPLYVRGPGIVAGSTNDNMVLTIDFLPTFVELAGGSPPPTADGSSLTPLLFNSSSVPQPWRTQFLIEYHGECTNSNTSLPEAGVFWQGTGATWGQSPSLWDVAFAHDATNNTYEGIRKLNETTNFVFGNWSMTGEREYYDISADPYQLTNLASSPKLQSLVESLEDLIAKFKTCSGDTCRAMGLPV